MKISTEEAFATPSMMAEWKKLIDDGNPGEPGLEQMIGAILDPVSDWDPAVRFVEEVIGEDRLMFAVDHPYANCNQQVQQAAAISLANADKFYHLNAKRVFKL